MVISAFLFAQTLVNRFEDKESLSQQAK